MSLLLTQSGHEALIRCNGNTQEGSRDGGDILACDFVLAGEQSFQLLLQITGAPVLFCSLECIHGWAVILSERINERRRRARKVESVGVPDKRYLFFWNSCACKSLDHVV